MVAKSLHRSVDLVNSVGKSLANKQLIKNRLSIKSTCNIFSVPRQKLSEGKGLASHEDILQTVHLCTCTTGARASCKGDGSRCTPLVKQRTKDKMLLSISGGQDSICLLVILNQLCAQMELKLGLVWCHHLWQIDSFSLMRQITKISYLFQLNSCFAVTPKPIPSELLARNWRHDCSARICLFYNYYKMSLAHSASDKTETILLNLMRGTGIAGLSPLSWEKKSDVQNMKKRKHVSQLLRFDNFKIFFFIWAPFFLPQRKKNKSYHLVVPTFSHETHAPHDAPRGQSLSISPSVGSKKTQIERSMESAPHTPYNTPIGTEQVQGLQAKRVLRFAIPLNLQCIAKRSKQYIDPTSQKERSVGGYRLLTVDPPATQLLYTVGVLHILHMHLCTMHDARCLLQLLYTPGVNSTKGARCAKVTVHLCPFDAAKLQRASCKEDPINTQRCKEAASQVHVNTLKGVKNRRRKRHKDKLGGASNWSMEDAHQLMQRKMSKPHNLLSLNSKKWFYSVSHTFFKTCPISFSQIKKNSQNLHQKFSSKTHFLCAQDTMHDNAPTSISFAPKVHGRQRSRCTFALAPLPQRGIVSHLHHRCPLLAKQECVHRAKKIEEGSAIHDAHTLALQEADTYGASETRCTMPASEALGSKGASCKEDPINTQGCKEAGSEVTKMQLATCDFHGLHSIAQQKNRSSGTEGIFAPSTIRPLLSLNRFEISKLCIYWELPVYPDQSNQKMSFLRNRVRKQLLPTIKLFFNSRIENVLLQFAEIFSDEDHYMNQITNKLFYQLGSADRFDHSPFSTCYYDQTSIAPLYTSGVKVQYLFDSPSSISFARCLLQLLYTPGVNSTKGAKVHGVKHQISSYTQNKNAIRKLPWSHTSLHTASPFDAVPRQKNWQANADDTQHFCASNQALILCNLPKAIRLPPTLHNAQCTYTFAHHQRWKKVHPLLHDAHTCTMVPADTYGASETRCTMPAREALGGKGEEVSSIINDSESMHFFSHMFTILLPIASNSASLNTIQKLPPSICKRSVEGATNKVGGNHDVQRFVYTERKCAAKVTFAPLVQQSCKGHRQRQQVYNQIILRFARCTIGAQSIYSSANYDTGGFETTLQQANASFECSVFSVSFRFFRSSLFSIKRRKYIVVPKMYKLCGLTFESTCCYISSVRHLQCTMHDAPLFVTPEVLQVQYTMHPLPSSLHDAFCSFAAPKGQRCTVTFAHRGPLVQRRWQKVHRVSLAPEVHVCVSCTVHCASCMSNDISLSTRCKIKNVSDVVKGYINRVSDRKNQNYLISYVYNKGVADRLMINVVNHDQLTFNLLWTEIKLNGHYVTPSSTPSGLLLFKRLYKSLKILSSIKTIPRYSMPLGATFWVWNRKFSKARKCSKISTSYRSMKSNSLFSFYQRCLTESFAEQQCTHLPTCSSEYFLHNAQCTIMPLLPSPLHTIEDGRRCTVGKDARCTSYASLALCTHGMNCSAHIKDASDKLPTPCFYILKVYTKKKNVLVSTLNKPFNWHKNPANISKRKIIITSLAPSMFAIKADAISTSLTFSILHTSLVKRSYAHAPVEGLIISPSSLASSLHNAQRTIMPLLPSPLHQRCTVGKDALTPLHTVHRRCKEDGRRCTVYCTMPTLAKRTPMVQVRHLLPSTLHDAHTREADTYGASETRCLLQLLYTPGVNSTKGAKVTVHLCSFAPKVHRASCKEDGRVQRCTVSRCTFAPLVLSNLLFERSCKRHRAKKMEEYKGVKKLRHRWRSVFNSKRQKMEKFTFLGLRRCNLMTVHLCPFGAAKLQKASCKDETSCIVSSPPTLRYCRFTRSNSFGDWRSVKEATTRLVLPSQLELSARIAIGRFFAPSVMEAKRRKWKNCFLKSWQMDKLRILDPRIALKAKQKKKDTNKLVNIFSKFDKLEIEKKEILWPLIISFLPKAIQRRFVKLFLVNKNFKQVRYSQIEQFLNIIKKF